MSAPVLTMRGKGTSETSLRINVNKKEMKREAGKPLLAEADERGDAISLGPGPRKSKAGSKGTHRGGWLGGGGRQQAHMPAEKCHPGTRRLAAKPSRVAEAGRGEAPAGQSRVVEARGSEGGSL